MAIVLLARGKRARDPTEQQAGHPRSVAEEAKRMQGARTTPARVGARVERRAFFSSTPRDSENRLAGRPDGEQDAQRCTVFFQASRPLTRVHQAATLGRSPSFAAAGESAKYSM